VLSQFIPVIGTYIAGALPVLIATLDSPRTGLWVFVVVAVYQQVENYGLAPKITARTMELHVAVAFGAVIAGAAVLGVVGALLALPFTATVQAFISTYAQQHDIDEKTLAESRQRRGRRGPPNG
jgi:predicted PurR-regulated permease PerM